MTSLPILSIRLICSLLLVLGLFLTPFPSVRAAPTEGSYGQLNKSDQQRIGDCRRDPYPILRQRYRPGKQSSREGADGINKLNADFACRLAEFLEKFPTICIGSAYRSDATQAVLWRGALAKYGSAAAARKWVAPPGSSMHNKGLAADLCGVPGNARSEAGKFGLVFRMGHEPWHIEPSGAVKGGTPAGNDAYSGPPSSGISDAARGLFGNQPTGQPSGFPSQATPMTQPSQQDQMCALPDGMQVPCSSIANRGGAPAGSPQPTPVGNPAPPTLPPSQQVGQYLQPSGSTQTSGSGSSAATSSEKKASAFEQIDAIAEPSGSAGETSTSEILLLSLSARDTRTLADEKVSPTTKTASTSQEIVENAPHSSETFTSSDLKDTASQTKYETQQVSGFQAALTALRDMLLIIIEYLKPFGRPAAEYYDEWAE